MDLQQFKGTSDVSEEWKQEERNLSKRMAAADKQIGKLLVFNHTTELKQRIDRLYEQSHSKAVERSQEETAVMGRLGSIRTGVGELKELLKFYEKKNEYLVKVQKLSESIVMNMEGFKEEMAEKYNECAGSEDQLTRELEIMEAKVDQYESGELKEEPSAIPSIISRPEKGKENKLMNRQQSMPDTTTNQQLADPILSKLAKVDDTLRQKTIEMEALEKIIAALGRNYGWPQDDHNDFLLIWSKRRGNNYFELEEQCSKHLRMYTSEQIHTHIDKHRKWLELQQSKKELLAGYRLLKEQKRSLEVKLVERNQAAQEEQQNREKRYHDLEKEEKERKEKLMQWKLMKQAKKQADELRQKQQEARKKEEERKKRRELEQKRLAYQQWKEESEAKKADELKQQQQQRPPRVRSAVQRETMEKIRQREQQLIKRKVDVLRAKEEQQRQRLKVHEGRIQKQQELRERKLIKYSHVNSKLQEKTTAIKQKERGKFDGTNPRQASTFGGVIGTGMGRAIPSWRQGL